MFVTGALNVELTYGLRQTFDNERIGVVDQGKNQILWQSAVEDEGVPVTLVHVVAGDN